MKIIFALVLSLVSLSAFAGGQTLQCCHCSNMTYTWRPNEAIPCGTGCVSDPTHNLDAATCAQGGYTLATPTPTPTPTPSCSVSSPWCEANISYSGCY